MNKIKQFFFAFIASALLLLGAFLPASAVAQDWRITAPKALTFVCGGTNYPHTLLTVIGNLVNGDFTGTGHYDTDNSYTWNLTGSTTGNALTFQILYTGTGAGYTLNGTGTIAGDGSISGTTDGNCQTFSMPAGSAVVFPTPLPTPVGPPVTLSECLNGGWQTFNTPVFADQAACTAYVLAHNHRINGAIKYTANALVRNAVFSMDTAHQTGSFIYSDVNHDWYIVNVSKVKVSGKTGWFAGKVILASNPAWTANWIFAKVSDNTPAVDQVWGSFTTQAAATTGVTNMTPPADGPFSVTSGPLLVN